MDRRDWILALLYTPNDHGESEPVQSWTELRLMLFLAHRKLCDFFDEESPFRFERGSHGPTDPALIDAVGSVIKDGLIRQEESQAADESDEPQNTYHLTDEGLTQAEHIYSSLTDEKQKILKWVKYSPSHDSRTDLLASVYRKHSGMFDSDFVN